MSACRLRFIIDQRRKDRAGTRKNLYRYSGIPRQTVPDPCKMSVRKRHHIWIGIGPADLRRVAGGDYMVLPEQRRRGAGHPRMIAQKKPDQLVISPGPGEPIKDGGISAAAIKHFTGKIPVLGVCLGHQCLGAVYGAKVDRASRLMHGKTSTVYHKAQGIFKDIPSPFEAMRYHSLIVYEPIPSELEVIAKTAEGEVMALKHRQHPTYGVQFHPESILTQHGKQLLKNFLETKISFAEGETTMLKPFIAKVISRTDLSADEAQEAMNIIMTGQATPAQIAAYLVALRMKGETIAEIGRAS